MAYKKASFTTYHLLPLKIYGKEYFESKEVMDRFFGGRPVS